MRHAAPSTTPGRRPGRAAQLVLGAIVYALAAMSAGLLVINATLIIWVLWQWLGVN